TQLTKDVQGYWDQIANISDYMTWLGPKLGVSRLDDWYDITQEALHKWGTGYLMEKHGLKKLLEQTYPHHHWDLVQFKHKSKGQSSLRRYATKQLKQHM